MRSAWYVAGGELRRSWRSTFVLVVLVGLAGATVLAAVAGARRTYTARDRYRQAYLAADVTVFHPDPERAGIERLESLPQVEAAGPIAFFLMRPPLDDDLGRNLDLDVAASADGRWGRDLDRFDVVEGRLPTEADELAISPAGAERLGLEIGDLIPFESATVEDFAAPQQGDGELPFDGPTVELTVVGLVQSPLEVLGSGSRELTAYLSPAFVAAYGDDIARYSPLRLRLRDGDAGFGDFSEAASRLTDGDPDLFLESAMEEDRRAEVGVGVTANGLLYFAAVASLAGLVAVGTALARALLAQEQSAYTALGLVRTERALAIGLGAVPVAVLGALVAVAIAVVASPLFPLSPARETEPAGGVDIDPLVLGLGGLAQAVGVLALGTGLAWRASARRTERPIGDRPSAVGRAMVAAGFTPAATTGVRLALEPGRGHSAVPVRPALVSGVAGVAGVVAVLIFGANLVLLVEEPERSGWNWDVAVAGVEGIPAAEAVERFAPSVAAVRGVGALAAVRNATADVGGRETQLLGFQPLQGAIGPTILEGRGPLTDAELAVGTETRVRLDLRLGDRLELEGPDGPATFVVVGLAAVTTYVGAEDPADGIALTMDGLDRLDAYVGTTDFVLEWAPGADVQAASAGLEGLNPDEPLGTTGDTDPVRNLARIRFLPTALGVFLALLALLAVGHALVVAVRRRRRDLAVLRALGLLRRQVAATVAWQSTTLALVGLVVGIPVGIALGRAAWREVAVGLGVVATPEVPLLGVVLVVPAALALANLLAALPARAAARTQAAAALRSE